MTFACRSGASQILDWIVSMPSVSLTANAAPIDADLAGHLHRRKSLTEPHTHYLPEHSDTTYAMINSGSGWREIET